MEILRKLRFETLPLSLSGVILGIMLAAADYMVDWKTALALMLFTSFLHLSVTAGKHGKEYHQMKKASSILLTLSVVCGVMAVYFTFGTLLLMESFVLMLLGYVVIRTARHTDFFDVTTNLSRKLVPVFLLTSLVPIYGAYYICSHSFGTWLLLLPVLAVGSLNLAIVRAETNINESTEMTPAFKITQVVLIVSGFVVMTVFAALRLSDIWHYLYLGSLPLFGIYIYIMLGTNPETRRMESNLLLVSTLMFSFLGGLGYVIFLL